jgi:hypothetical protein
MRATGGAAKRDARKCSRQTISVPVTRSPLLFVSLALEDPARGSLHAQAFDPAFHPFNRFGDQCPEEKAPWAGKLYIDKAVDQESERQHRHDHRRNQQQPVLFGPGMVDDDVTRSLVDQIQRVVTASSFREKGSCSRLFLMLPSIRKKPRETI